MSSRADSPARELLRLYSLASPGEYNLAQFLERHPELVLQVEAPLDLEHDDAKLALQLAPVIGRLKRRAAHLTASARMERIAAASQQLIATARPELGSINLDARLLLGELLADHSTKYILFELVGGCVPILRGAIARTRISLRNFKEVSAFVDLRGLHFRWRAGAGGLNFHPQIWDRSASALRLDFRRALPARPRLPHPVRLVDVLADLGLP